MIREGRVIVKGVCVFCLLEYNCIIIFLRVTVFVCNNKGNGFLFFLYNKFTSICILETINNTNKFSFTNDWDVFVI